MWLQGKVQVSLGRATRGKQVSRCSSQSAHRRLLCHHDSDGRHRRLRLRGRILCPKHHALGTACEGPLCGSVVCCAGEVREFFARRNSQACMPMRAVDADSVSWVAYFAAKQWYAWGVCARAHWAGVCLRGQGEGSRELPHALVPTLWQCNLSCCLCFTRRLCPLPVVVRAYVGNASLWGFACRSNQAARRLRTRILTLVTTVSIRAPRICTAHPATVSWRDFGLNCVMATTTYNSLT